MEAFVVIIVISIAVTVCCFVAEGLPLMFKDVFCSIFIGFLVFLLLGLLWFLASGIALATCDTEEYLYSEFEIEALKDNISTEGKMAGGLFISSGYIKDELHYYYIINTEKGRKVYNLSADRAYIQYSKDEKPHITIYHRRPIVDWRSRVFWLIQSQDAFDYAILVVPPDSVTNEINIDLE